MNLAKDASGKLPVGERQLGRTMSNNLGLEDQPRRANSDTHASRWVQGFWVN